MKKIMLLSAALLFAASAAFAQGTMVVNSEKIFKSVARYNEAITSLEKLGEQYQKNIDAAYANIEKMYSEYIAQKPYLSESTRQTREDAIIKREQEVGKYQQDIFGPEGEMMKKRIEMIKPIQDLVFAAVNRYAEANKFDLVLDVANNPSVLFYAPANDRTEEIIKLLQQ